MQLATASNREPVVTSQSVGLNNLLRWHNRFIRTWSIGLDGWILLQTLGVVLRQKGAY